MQPGDLVFSRNIYTTPQTPVMNAGPLLVKRVSPTGAHIDVLYLKPNPHFTCPKTGGQQQTNGHQYPGDFMPMDFIPDVWLHEMEEWIGTALQHVGPDIGVRALQAFEQLNPPTYSWLEEYYEDR